MVAADRSKEAVAALAASHISLAGGIAARLHRSYAWVPMDDLHSYAYLGITLAARTYDSSRGVPFDRFAVRKGRFLAIDQMRKDGVLQRRRVTASASTGPLTGDIQDPRSDDEVGRMETRDLCATLLGKISPDDRRLLMMYYADHLTFREISRVLDVSESAVCLRHKALLRRLRKMAKASIRP